MIKNLTYKQRLRWLAAVALLMIILCYRFSVAKAIGEYSLNKRLKELSLQNTDQGALAMLETKNRMLDKMLNQFVLDTLDETRSLLSIAGDYCDQSGLKLKEYKLMGSSKIDSMSVFTRSITVEGSFKECLELVYELETKSQTGRVTSVTFKSFSEPATSRTFLNCTIYIQNVISSLYEKA